MNIRVNRLEIVVGFLTTISRRSATFFSRGEERIMSEILSISFRTDDERNVKISTGTKGEKIPLSFFQRLLHRPELLFVRYPPIILQRE